MVSIIAMKNNWLRKTANKMADEWQILPLGVVPSSFRQQYMQVHGPPANCQLNRSWHWEEDNRYSNW